MSSLHSNKNKIFIVGLQKCGTTSFQDLLTTLGYKSCHHTVGSEFVGSILKKNIDSGKDILDGLHEFDAFTQMDYDLGNIWPQIDYIDILVELYPHAKYILNTRDPIKHATSLMNFKGRHDAIIRSDITGLPVGKGKTVEDLAEWVQWHNDRTRSYFKERVHIPFLEVEITDANLVGDLTKFLDVSTPKPVIFPHLNRRS